MAVGDRGTLVIQRPRTVRPGGVIRYYGEHQHDRLKEHVGETVMVHEAGSGGLDINECWYERVIDARLARYLRRKRQHRWVIGKHICWIQTDASDG